MGRVISGISGAVAGGSVGAGNSFKLKAGAAMSLNDTTMMGPDGLGYPVVCTDYAAISNTGALTSTATGQVVAPTSIIATAYQNLTMRRPQVMIDTSGNTIILGNSSGSGNAPLDAKVYKYSPGGTLLKSLALSSGLTGNMYGAYFFRLSNNNICAVFGLYSAGIGYLYFAVCNEDLNIVVNATAIEATYGITPFGCCKLSGGGFAVSYTLNATPTAQRLAIYSNAGAATYGPATIRTWAGSGGNTCTSLAELSNGNIGFAVNSGSSSGPGLYHAVYSPAGAAVVAFANLEAVLINNGNATPEISTLTGFYCVSIGNATNYKAHVFSNAGAIQGAPFSSATTIVAPLSHKLVSDGVAFYALWPDNNVSATKLTKLPITGAGYVTNTITTAVAYPGTTGGIDAIVDRANILAITSFTTTTAPAIGVVNTSGFVQKTSTVITSSAPSTSGANTASVTPVGDYAFLACYDYTSTAGQFFMVGKYANSCVLGACIEAASSGSLFSISQGAGSYPTNALKGTTSKLFDHTTGANQYGNKGVMLTNGIVLKGMGA